MSRETCRAWTYKVRRGEQAKRRDDAIRLEVV